VERYRHQPREVEYYIDITRPWHISPIDGRIFYSDEEES